MSMPIIRKIASGNLGGILKMLEELKAMRQEALD